MKRVVFNEPGMGEFIAEGAKCPFQPGVDNTIGVVDDSHPEGSPARIRGGAIYTWYTGASVWMHVAARDEAWLTRDMLALGFDYPFNQLGVGRIYGFVEAVNAPALQFDLKLGFRIHATLPGMFASGEGIVVVMEKHECRWLGMKPRRWKGPDDGR